MELLAKTLSMLFYPFPVAIVTLFVAIGLTESSWSQAISWTGVSVLIVIVPVGLAILWKLRQGEYKDWDVPIQENRHLLYAITLGGFAILMGVYFMWQAPTVAFVCAYAAIPTLGIAMLINRKWTKISLHATTLAGCVILLWFVSPIGSLILLLCGLATSWARVYLKRHTVNQVVLGWLVGCPFVGVIAFWQGV